MTKLKLYYHMTDQPRWRELVDLKIDLMKSVGLWEAFSEINLCVHYNNAEFDQLRFDTKDDPRIRIIFHTDSVRTFGEQYTNRTIKQEVDACDADAYIFRMHTKGLNWINTPDWERVSAYTELLDQHNIVRWKEVVQKLDQGYDATGIYWVKNPWPHFMGNIWWATSKYIKQLKILPPPHETGFRQQILGGGWAVHDAESWVGTGNATAWDFIRESDQIGDHPNI